MLNDKNLQFIKEKIEDLGVALLHCHSKGLLRIPNTIIQTHAVDENGDILFFINRPTQLLSEFDQEFLVNLNYFKKGKKYFVNIFGKARIINDPEELTYILELTPEEINNALTQQVLIKVKILNVEVIDNDFEKKNFLLKKTQSLFYGLFDWGEPNARSYNFRTDSSLQQYGF
jgi:general stress protein 26